MNERKRDTCRKLPCFLFTVSQHAGDEPACGGLGRMPLGQAGEQAKHKSHLSTKAC